MRREFITLGATILLQPLAAGAQQMAGSSSMHVVQQPYSIESWGEFRRMMMTGDFSPKVQLGELMANHPTTGVGAVSEARGEITIYDGKLIVSYGKDGQHVDPTTDSAALLAIGSAPDWQSATVDRDIAPEDVESYLATAAKANGIDPEKSFPFEVRGTLAPYVMHVNAASTGGPHGMGLPMAITVESKGETIEGRIAGLYVSADLMGVATHDGERTHAHWVSPDGASTAHLDRWGLKAGATLMLPKP
jgi:hypothetical protein